MATRKEIIDLQVQYGTLEGLESQLEQVNSELKQTQIGSDAFKSLTQEAQKLNAAIEGVNNQVAGITLEDKLFAADGAIKTFAGSVEATVGALGLLGIESEALGAFEEKAASAISFGMGLKDMAEGFGQVTQMAAKANLATKLFGNTSRAVLVSTGVGAIVVALGLIVAYWDKISVAIGLATDTTEAFKEASEAASQETAKFNEQLLTFENTLNQSKAGIISKDKALDQYNQTLASSLGYANDLQQAEKLIALNAPLFTQLTLKKAEAQVLLARAAEASAKIASGQALELNWWQKIISSVSVLGSAAVTASFQIQNLDKTLKEQKVNSEAYAKSIQGVADIQKQLDANVVKVTGSIKYQEDAVKDNTKTTNVSTKAIKEESVAVEKLTENVLDLTDVRRQLQRQFLEALAPEYSPFLQIEDQFQEAIKDIQAGSEEYITAFNTYLLRFSELVKSNVQKEVDDLFSYIDQRTQKEELTNIVRKLHSLFLDKTITDEAQREVEKYFGTLLFTLEDKRTRLLAGLIPGSDEFQKALAEWQTEFEVLTLAMGTAMFNARNKDTAESIRLAGEFADNILAIGDAAAATFGELSKFWDASSKASKVFALAQITTTFAVGLIGAIRFAQEATEGLKGPFKIAAYAAIYGQQLASLLAAVNQARGIINTQSTSGGSASPGAGTAPTTGVVTTAPPSQPSLTPLIRTYILSGDVRNSLEADAKLSKRRVI